MASLDEGDFTAAQNLITTLERQFPGSARVGRIAGMLLEAKGMYPQAIKHYEEILKKDITNISIMKRKVWVIVLTIEQIDFYGKCLLALCEKSAARLERFSG